MSAVFAERVTVEHAPEKGKGVINLVDARLKPGDVVEIEVRMVDQGVSSAGLLRATRLLALDLPKEYSTSFESKL
jgi:hypothetical protein